VETFWISLPMLLSLKTWGDTRLRDGLSLLLSMVWLLSIQADDQDIFGGRVPLLMLSLLAMMQLQRQSFGC